MVKKDIYTELHNAVEQIIDNAGGLSEVRDIDVNTDVTGLINGELTDATFEGVIKVRNYSYTRGNYLTPPETDADVTYSGVLSWFADEDCTELITEKVCERL